MVQLSVPELVKLAFADVLPGEHVGTIAESLATQTMLLNDNPFCPHRVALCVLLGENLRVIRELRRTQQQIKQRLKAAEIQQARSEVRQLLRLADRWGFLQEAFAEQLERMKAE